MRSADIPGVGGDAAPIAGDAVSCPACRQPFKTRGKICFSEGCRRFRRKRDGTLVDYSGKGSKSKPKAKPKAEASTLAVSSPSPKKPASPFLASYAADLGAEYTAAHTIGKALDSVSPEVRARLIAWVSSLT